MPISVSFFKPKSALFAFISGASGETVESGFSVVLIFSSIFPSSSSCASTFATPSPVEVVPSSDISLRVPTMDLVTLSFAPGGGGVVLPDP